MHFITLGGKKSNHQLLAVYSTGNSCSATRTGCPDYRISKVLKKSNNKFDPPNDLKYQKYHQKEAVYQNQVSENDDKNLLSLHLHFKPLPPRRVQWDSVHPKTQPRQYIDSLLQVNGQNAALEKREHLEGRKDRGERRCAFFFLLFFI